MLVEKKLSKIAKVADAKLIGKDLGFNKISTDTRTIKKGDIFLALKGENFDGHDFIETAIEKGASSIISERELGEKINYIKTKNNFKFLKLLAKKIRSNFKGTCLLYTSPSPRDH